MTVCCEHELKLEKNRVIDRFIQDISKKRNDADEMQAKLDYFIKYFDKHFEKEDI